tara:strand:+ start:2199 stop:2708 length:510 start_codon:yes stop_codon:yes gene_type:complete
MAVPTSGAISLRRLAAEKYYDNYNITLDGLAQGTLGTTSLRDVSTSGNTYGSTISFESTNTSGNCTYPNASAPFSMSEFRGYDHDGSSILNSGILGYSSSSGTGACDNLLSGTTYYWSNCSNTPVKDKIAIYSNASLTSYAPAGYYADGWFNLWTGTSWAFSNSTDCQF